MVKLNRIAHFTPLSISAALLALSQPLVAQPYYYGQPYYAPPPQPYYAQPPGAGQWGYGQPLPSQPSPVEPTATPYRPIPPSNAQGVPPRDPTAPIFPGYTGQAPSWSPNYPLSYPPNYAANAPLPSAAPTLAWTLTVADPYVQQPTLLTLEVISHDNLSQVNLELPNTSDALLSRLSGPDTETRTTSGQMEIVNRFVLTVVPLRTGDVQLPPLTVNGTLAGLGQRYSVQTERPIRLQVRPAMISVRPWLPLESLTLRSHLDRDGPLEPGQPVTLALEIAAVGGTAVQLPSLENQLTSADLRVYREQTLTSTELSADRQQLLATRTEYYTLVPQRSGHLTLPEMTLAWWNVTQGSRDLARLPLTTLEVHGGGPFGVSTALLAASPWVKLWIPVSGVLLLIGGYWIGVFYRGRVLDVGRDLVCWSGRGLRSGYRLTADWLGPQLRSLVAAIRRQQITARLWRLLPRQQRSIAQVRYANQHAHQPNEWYVHFAAAPTGQQMQRGATEQAAVIAQLCAQRPQLERAELVRLLRQLDAAIYGSAPLDFPRWKRDMMRQMQRGSVLKPSRSETITRRYRWAGLPALNPRAS